MTLEVNVFEFLGSHTKRMSVLTLTWSMSLFLEDEYIKNDSNPLDFLLDDFDIDDSYSHAVNVVDVFDKS